MSVDLDCERVQTGQNAKKKKTNKNKNLVCNNRLQNVNILLPVIIQPLNCQIF